MSKAIRGLTGHVGFFKPLKNTSLGPLEEHLSNRLNLEKKWKMCLPISSQDKLLGILSTSKRYNPSSGPLEEHL
jgi:hypothetical protein